ncbi:MAG TPA: response regulator [Bacteroidia bacterium]|nr:response regulator [Bacteroidia bacterium]
MSNKANSIVIVDDDRHFASRVEYELEMNGYTNARTFHEPQDFLDSLEKEPYLVILDFQFDDTTGLDVLREIKTLNPEIHVIMFSGQEYICNAVSTLEYVAYDYVLKDDMAFDNLDKVMTNLNGVLSIRKEVKSLRKTVKKQNRRFAWTLFGVVLLVALSFRFIH